jgi:hypothetical protein
MLSGDLMSSRYIGQFNVYGVMYATPSISSGKFYFEALVTGTSVSTDDLGIGIGNTSSVVDDFRYIGDSTDTIGWYGGSGGIWQNGSVVATWATFSTGSVLCIALDATNNKLWGRVGAGNWNNDVLANQNPANNVGGYAIPASVYGSAMSPGATMQTNTTPDSVTGYFMSSTWTQSPPSGFIQFDPPLPTFGRKF